MSERAREREFRSTGKVATCHFSGDLASSRFRFVFLFVPLFPGIFGTNSLYALSCEVELAFGAVSTVHGFTCQRHSFVSTASMPAHSLLCSQTTGTDSSLVANV